MPGRPFRIGDSMRRKLTFALLSLALTLAALVSGARPAQAGYGCVTYYCTDTGCCYSCCFLPNREPICTEPCAPTE
jgi:hypothetical protein